MTDKDKDTKPEPKPVPKEIPAGGTQGAYSATTVSVPPEEMLTEQEKDTTSELPGVGPVTPTVTEVVPVETIEDLGIGPREPYPTSDVPPVMATAKTKGPAK